MSNPRLSVAATGLLQTYGGTAHHLIDAYRAGSERIGHYAEQRYVRALETSASQLTPEVRENALVAQKIVSAYYAKGVALASDGAQTVVDSLVKYAGMGLEQAAANASKFEEKTGVTALNKLASVAVPAVVTVTDIAKQIEEKAATLSAKLRTTDKASKKTSKKK